MSDRISGATTLEDAMPVRRGRPPASAGDRQHRRSVIEHAALSCLRTKTFADLTIDEIASAAGVSRRTFYRFFTSKRALFSQILKQRAATIAEAVKLFTARCENFSSAIIEGTMETLRLIEQDAIFKALIEAESRLMLDIMDVEIEASAPSLFLLTWADVFSCGRESGALRPSISDVEAAQWLRGVHFLLTLRSDLDEAQKRALLTCFVVPSLTLTEG